LGHLLDINHENTKNSLDRINRIARIEYERMNDRSEAPHALAHEEALMTHIKALEKLHGLGTSQLVSIRESFFKPLLSDLQGISHRASVESV